MKPIWQQMATVDDGSIVERGERTDRRALEYRVLDITNQERSNLPDKEFCLKWMP